jgi:N-acetylmuramoyl-L-alanine amidase
MLRVRNYPLGLLIGLIFCLIWPAVANALTARDEYYSAQNCYHQLKKYPKKQKYRDNWLRCIDKFKAVYRHDPSGPWAAAGLYMTGQLYQALYKRSYKASDRQEALDAYERIVKRYPQSRYKPKAVAAIKKIPESAKTTKAPPRPSSDKSIRSKYAEAESCYQKLAKNAKKRRYRENWLQCIEKFQDVHRSNPSGPWAAAGLFRTAEVYRELYAYSNRAADIQTSHELFEQIVADYPQSMYHPKSVAALKRMPSVAKVRVKNLKPQTKPAKPKTKSDDIARIIKDAAPSASTKQANRALKTGKIVTVNNLRFWSNPNYTRVVIDANRETGYSHRLLKKDPEIHKPQRLYVDLNNSKLKPDLDRQVPINDNLLTHVRAGQYKKDAVRVVVDIKSFKTYKIFSLKNPFRIVIDVWGHGGQTTNNMIVASPEPNKSATGSLAQQLALGVRRIVIDPGHGGRDYGAPGYYKGVHEKNITLAIGKRLAEKIRKELNCEAILTRDRDRYLSLEERTAIANTKNADLFISIHTNAARDRRAYGIETYFLNLATDDDAILVAARENATSTKNISDLQSILNDLMQNAKINESSRLAAEVQVSMYKTLRGKYSRIKSKGVKQAPFYVLLGAQMPSVLIETSFISNSRECKRLKDPHYQNLMCDGIIAGIKKYVRHTNPSAFMTSRK